HRRRRFTEPTVQRQSAQNFNARSSALVAPLSRNLPPFASRPALVVVALALGGLLVDLFVRPVSTEGFLLILLAASPFLLELVRQPRPEAVADAPEAARP